MFDLSHLSIMATVFFITLTIVGLLPDLIKTYRERYEVESRKTTRELTKFFITVKPGKIVAIFAAAGLAFGLLTRSWVFGFTIAACGVAAPRVMLRIWRDIRTRQVEAQLMDALILIGNSLKSGLDIAAGIERVALDMKPPISEEFGLVINAYRLGTPIEIALMDLTERIPSRTLETVVYAINIQRETGGNIIKTFDQLVTTIRDESKLQKKVEALTAQGRSQVMFLSVFPWLIGLVFFFLAGDMMRPALQSTVGQVVLVLLVFWELIGILVTKKIVQVEL